MESRFKRQIFQALKNKTGGKPYTNNKI